MKPEVRIAAIGNVDSAKTTTVSVIINNILDNGRGNARSKILKHPHEEVSGRTSSVTQNFIETDKNIYGFIDLAGHEKYLKTTLSGLNGCYVDYAMVTIGADRGIIGMTREHLTLAIVLKLPIIVVITKMDIAAKHKIEKIRSNLAKLFSHPLAGRKNVKFINNSNINECMNTPLKDSREVPIFEISNISGENVHNLRKYILSLKPYKEIGNKNAVNTLFKVDATFKIDGHGIVISGIVQDGTISRGNKLHLGPFNGQFIEVIIKSIHDNFRRDILYLESGQNGCLNIKVVQPKKNILKRSKIKQGIILVTNPYAIRKFDANVTILHHPTTIKPNYEPVIHCGGVRQTARICQMDHELARAGDTANVTFEFKFKPEFIQINNDIVFREGNTKGIGKIIKIY